MTLQQFFKILFARWRAIAIVFWACVLISVLLVLLWTKKYSADAAVLLDVKSTDPITGTVLPGLVTQGYMATQVDIVKSERVAIAAVKIGKLDQSAAYREAWEKATEGRGSFESWIAQVIQRKLDVVPGRESNVITIGYTHENPKIAAYFANAFAQAYIETSLELKVGPAKQYANWFDERGRQVKANLAAAQQKLSDFQRANGITALDEKFDVESARLAELSTQLVGVQGVRAETESRERQASGNKDTLPEVVQSALIGNLKTDLARAESQREDVVTRLGKNHPEYLRIESQIASLRDRISLETAKIANSMGTNNKVSQQREFEIHAALDAQKQKVLTLKKQRDELQGLQNEVISAQRTYDLVAQRYAQTSLESENQQTNVVLLNPATEPLEPSSPRWLYFTLTGVFLGVTGGVSIALLLELLNRRVRGSEDLESIQGVPVLGLIKAGTKRKSAKKGLAALLPVRA